MFRPKHIKEGKMLLKGVKKFIHYKRDLLSEERLDEIRQKRAVLRQLLKSGEKEHISKQSRDLQKTCEGALPMPSCPGIRENVEVFFVAIVIALGIRSYFLQPFKIPTGSMQPTLNGIIAHGFDDSDDAASPYGEAAWAKVKPNIVVKGWDLLWQGRNYVDLRAREDFRVTDVYQKNLFKFFSVTYIAREKPDGSRLKRLIIWAPLDKTIPYPGQGGLGLARALGLSPVHFTEVVERAKRGNPMEPRLARRDLRRLRGRKVKKGTLLARGYVDTGDQVLVNKVSYHFRKPRRGEVFVFTTKDIRGLMNRSPNRMSQHYIKRLCALPGDAYEIKSPDLFVDGQRAREPGILRVSNGQNGYPGYRRFTRNHDDSRPMYNKGRLRDKEYLALGDNSPNSSDSRDWGPVNEKNLVGPGFFVYWPFGRHWGLID